MCSCLLLAPVPPLLLSVSENQILAFLAESRDAWIRPLDVTESPEGWQQILEERKYKMVKKYHKVLHCVQVLHCVLSLEKLQVPFKNVWSYEQTAFGRIGQPAWFSFTLKMHSDFQHLINFLSLRESFFNLPFLLLIEK